MKLFKRATFPQLNFLSVSRDRRRRRQRWLIASGVAVGVVVLLTLLILPPVLGTIRAAKSFQHRLIKGQQLMAAQRFSDARTQFANAKTSLNQATRSYRRLRWWRFAPLLGSNIRALDGLLDIGAVVLRVADRTNTFAEDLLGPFAKKGKTLTLGSLTVEERRQLLEKLGQAEPTLNAVHDDVQSIIETLDQLPKSYVKRRIDRELAPVRDNLILIEEALARAAPIARMLPTLLGYNVPQTYLFLLQNNAELRPTGGFIGTFGIIKVQNGDITTFTTDNAYNLDDRVKGKLFIAPPEPLRLYNSADAWFFRDANWSPDFPTAAAETKSFYAKEGGRERLDGVLAVTPTFIESLLGLTGDISVNGITFTKDNFHDTLQEQVTFGFYRQGLAQSERKEVIGTMGQELMERLYALPQNQWGDFWQIMLTEFLEKQILVNFNDQALQSFAETQRWAGRLETTDGDYLYLVDANLASLKTDPVVKRTIDYALQEADGKLTATATITYRHEGQFDKKTTRYRTYARLYVPAGSSLMASQGADQTDRSDRPGKVLTKDELGKTVFEAFKSIEPGTTETLSFTYALPDRLMLPVRAGQYALFVQKQPGTDAHALRLRLAFVNDIRAIDGVDNPPANPHTTLSQETDLRHDRDLTVYFR